MHSRILGLAKEYPRSPSETPGGYVHAARMLDKWFDVYDLEEERI